MITVMGAESPAEQDDRPRDYIETIADLIDSLEAATEFYKGYQFSPMHSLLLDARISTSQLLFLEMIEEQRLSKRPLRLDQEHSDNLSQSRREANAVMCAIQQTISSAETRALMHVCSATARWGEVVEWWSK